MNVLDVISSFVYTLDVLAGRALWLHERLDWRLCRLLCSRKALVLFVLISDYSCSLFPLRDRAFLVEREPVESSRRSTCNLARGPKLPVDQL